MIDHIPESRQPNQLKTAAAALSSMREKGDTREEGSIATTTRELRKSCDRCGLKKRRCDGRAPCQRCVRIGEICRYGRRRPRTVKPLPPAQLARLHRSAGLEPYGHGMTEVSLKRCRLSPSPATGLVGMPENTFLSDYFGCVGFLRFTSQSNIRETMVKMFAGSVAVQRSDSGDFSTTEQHFDTLMPADSELPMDPSTCVFWCAVALGALVKGRPIESVGKYSRLARKALANAQGPANAEVARAWTILAYLSDFCGDHESFHANLQRANATLSKLQEGGNQSLPEGLCEAVVHGEAVTLFVGELDSKEVESFCSQENANPQITEAATEGDISQFVMRSYRSFEQGFHENIAEHRPTAHSLEGDGEPSTDITSGDPIGPDLVNGPRPRFFASVMREGAGLCSSGIVDVMTMVTRKHSRRFQRIEHAAGRPTIREGVGGFIINGSLIFEKIAGKDIGGALENLEKCGEVLQRYPGLCRFIMWSHVTHMLMSYLAIMDGPRARGIYDQMRAAYNSALRPGTRPIPPFEEWEGLSSYCDNYNCRLVELMVMIQLGDASSCSPSRERATETQEQGSSDAPVENRQQRGVSSATGSQEQVEGTSAVVKQFTQKTTDTSRSEREPERVSDEESVECMEDVPSGECRTAPKRSQEPTIASPLFRKVSSEPIVISDSDPAVTEKNNSNLSAKFGGQAAEALLSLSMEGRAMIGETEDDRIDVEDWLDVNHAMLDPVGRGLDSK